MYWSSSRPTAALEESNGDSETMEFLIILANFLGQGEGARGGPLTGLLPFVFLIAIFWFLIFAPARKKQKRLQELINNLRNGDKVITSGGIYGTVVGVADRVVQLRIADGVKIDVGKHAIIGKQDQGEIT